MDRYILAMDQGTTSSRAIVFNKLGEAISTVQKEFEQYFPKPGWVEHDAEEIWASQLEVSREAIKQAGITPSQIVSIGITNQRETTVIWDRKTGKPVYNAIVWQCRRTSEMCKIIEETGVKNIIRDKTGLILDAYFSGTKVKWLLDNVPGLMEKAQKGDLCFGTIDSWLLFKLTGNHATEPSNASRTLLFNINTGSWDDDLLDIFGIPKSLLPKVQPSSSLFGQTKKELFGIEIPISGMAGDQQAALFGQTCFNIGDCKNTYGTGCFALLNTGKKPAVSKNNLLTTVAWDLGDGMEYAVEGSVFIAGALIKWLRDQLGLIETASETDLLAKSVPDTAGVFVVPAFVGLGAPYWDSDARGSILGLTRGSTKAHVVRAALESIAFLSRDLIEALQEDSGKRIASLKVDGGASMNSFLMQFQSDILGIPVIRPKMAETTALGAAYLSGLYSGYWDSKDEILKNWQIGATFRSDMDIYKRMKLITKWNKAVKATRNYK
ncbi:MAG TPA: glycerol kinase [Lentisphaeria bacterium]|nr:MAG: glycerol kinase [Lentisphaerae bacterium GWF2_38_69]HBM15552.1 glycerol kinase [Lentisphaeria bacterium]